MKRPGWVACALIAVLAFPTLAHARGLSVEVWTNRGDEAVYNKGDLLKIGVRANDDAHLIVYEIDAEGYVNLLFPYQGTGDLVEARQSYRIPEEDAGVDLVVEGPTGQGYIVAIASLDPFQPLPWYLRPYSSQAAALGYEGGPEEEEGVTSEGRIVGDPFVAMERIRRRIVSDYENPDLFATAYTTYYLHEPVKYPRYLCYDCHRPGYWSWWTGFDPYYTTCSVFTFRVNYSWYWGPGYWFGHVPYYVYNCRPGYGWHGRYWYSGWDGWGYWSSIWGGPLRRYKSPPPPGYMPPDKYKDGTPPGLIAARDFRRGGNMTLPIGRNDRARDGDTPERIERGERGVQRQPAGEVRRDDDARRPGDERGGIQRRPASERPRDEGDVRRPMDRPSPRREPAREPAREPSREPAREPSREPAREPSREPAREPSREPEPAPAPAPPSPPAPKPRDEARPMPPRGGSRGGDRGNQIGASEVRQQRGVQRGGLKFAGEIKRGAAPVRDGSAYRGPDRSRGAAPRATRQAYTTPRQVQRSAARMTPTREMRAPRAPSVGSARAQKAPARVQASKPGAQKSEARAQKSAPRAQQSSRGNARGDAGRGGRGGR
jgi:hypothetical protein